MAIAGCREALFLFFLWYLAADSASGALLSPRGSASVWPASAGASFRQQQLPPPASLVGSSPAAFIPGGSSADLAAPRRVPSPLQAAASSQAAACSGGGCRIVGLGSAVPPTRLTNDDLSRVVETNDEWIRTRTGIQARRVLRQGESLRELSLRAGREALAASGVRAQDIDLLLHASSSPDDLFGDGPWLAAELQTQGNPPPPAFDLTAACSGFVVGLVTGSDALSRWVDWTDRNTCILFGDAAGAAVLAAPEAAPPADEAKPLGLLSYVLHSDGKEQKQITLSYKGTDNPLPFRHSESGRLMLSRGCFSPMSMNGREVFKFVSRKVPSSLEAVLQAAKLNASDVDWLLLHQANKRIIDAVAERLGIPQEKVLCNLEEYGNTSAASVPLCLSEAVRAGKVKKGDVILMAGFGAGLTWAAAALRYG